MKCVLFILLSIALCGLSAMGQTVYTFTADQPEELIASAGPDRTITEGESVSLGETPAASGGTAPYSYSWSDGTEEVSTESNPTLSPPETAVYSLMVADDLSCTSIDHLYIYVEPNVINDFTERELKIYPNPSSKEFTVEFHDGECTLLLFDEQGTLVMTSSMTKKTTFPVPKSPGTYLLKITSADRASVRRIVVTE